MADETKPAVPASNFQAIATPPVKPPSPVTPRPASISTGVGQAVAKSVPIPKGMVLGSTLEIPARYMHVLIYGETDARKTTTAAMFGTPEQTRIVQTRRTEQLIALGGKDYQYVLADTPEKFEFAMNYPERLWPDWSKREDRVLVVDDITETKDQMVDDNSTTTTSSGEEREVRDLRKIHVGAKKDMRQCMKAAIGKPQHLVVVALARVVLSELSGEEVISPDLPPAMANMLGSDFEYVFYIKKGSAYKFLTCEDRVLYQKKDDKTGEVKQLLRKVFSKAKVPVGSVGVLQKEEPLDLQAIWKKVQAARGGK